MDFTKFISEASNMTTSDSLVSLWEDKIDTESFLWGMAMEILTSNAGGYFIMTNNYLLYDDIENERLIFSGFDFDLTMGRGIKKSISTMSPKNDGMGGLMSSADSIPFIGAVNGPVNDSNSLALKECIELRNQNILNFYNKND